MIRWRCTYYTICYYMYKWLKIWERVSLKKKKIWEWECDRVCVDGMDFRVEVGGRLRGFFICMHRGGHTFKTTALRVGFFFFFSSFLSFFLRVDYENLNFRLQEEYVSITIELCSLLKTIVFFIVFIIRLIFFPILTLNMSCCINFHPKLLIHGTGL